MASEHDKREKKLRCHRAEENLEFKEKRYPIVTCPPFSKALPHDALGTADRAQVDLLICSIRTQSTKGIDAVRLGGTVKLSNPSAAWTQDFLGRYSDTFKIALPGPLASPKTGQALVLLYSMALARDVRFDEYASSPLIAKILGYINAAAVPAAPSTVFRGALAAGLPGPYLSQFLYLPFGEGGYPVAQKYPALAPGVDYMKTLEAAVKVQNGAGTEAEAPRIPARYIITGRDLAGYVRRNEPAGPYIRAAYYLLGNVAPNPGLPKSTSEGFLVDVGRIDVLDVLGRAARLASMAGSRVKWQVMYPRPEAVGIAVEVSRKTQSNPHCISQTLMANPVLTAAVEAWGSMLLAQAYPEGSPTHPSFPGNHSGIAGACITVLKFFFDGDALIPLFAPDAAGSAIANTGEKGTVNNELAKLAANISSGREWAGVHYNADAEGVLLGEKVGIYLLKDIVKRYPRGMNVPVRLFSGDIIYFTN